MMIRCRLRKRLILYAVIINIILIVILNILYLDKGVSLQDFSVNASKNFIQKLVPKQKRVLTFEIGRPKPEGKTPTCRFTQSEGLQILAEDYLYPSDQSHGKKCLKSTQSICTIDGSFDSVSVSCENNTCGKTVKVGWLHRETGDVQWEVVSSSKLETFIQDVGLKSMDSMYPFFFLKCGKVPVSKGASVEGGFTQLLSLPLAISSNNSKQSLTLSQKGINVNIVFLDAVSRRHFYRSLPKTIVAFREINLNPKSTSNVLDFELYQALRAKPTETLLGFITGKNYDESGKAIAKPLLSRFKDAGYQTLWQEDLCWKFGHGFVKDFGLAHVSAKDRWQGIKQAMKSNDIDSLGITHSSCYIFQENDVNSMDDYDKKGICFNGKLQHEYFLDFLGRYLAEVDSKESTKPLFSLTTLNLGQEESGRHVQMLDKSLASFVKKMAGDKNTITFLISNHGNTFEKFPVQTNEGQYEQYNPFLFMVLPKFVERKLGEWKKNNLLNNQLRLMSISDVHGSVMALVENPKELNVTQDQGVFKEIAFDRNCETLGLSSLSLCICDGWSSKQHANLFHYVVAEFALGQLNNMIAIQYLNQRSVNKQLPFTSCERLHGMHLKNISQKRIENGYIITQIDIFVQRNEVFTVEVKWHGDDNPAMAMELVNYKRNGKYSSCPSYIDQDLCLCQAAPQKQKLSQNGPNWKKYGNVFDRKTKAENRHLHCLYMLTRDYGASTVFEAANMCDNVEYSVTMNFDLQNMRTPMSVPLNATIGPRSIHFLTFVTPLHLTNPGSWEFEFDFTVH